MPPELSPACDTTKLRELFDRGLSSGLGDADGQVCIEAAISLACGGELDDAPPCVAEPDRQFSIRANDASWSSPQARAEAMWPLALAQIGTAGKDRSKWVAAVAEGMIRRVLPRILRMVADLGAMPEANREELRQAAGQCEQVGSISAADSAASAARAAARAAASAADSADSAADRAAASAAYSAADGADSDAGSAADGGRAGDGGADSAARAAASAADSAAYSAASAADSAAYSAADSAAARDEILRLSVKVALDAYEKCDNS